MSKKQLNSAVDVQAAAKRGEHVLYLQDKTTIVTAQAASVAKDLGVSLELKKNCAANSGSAITPDEQIVRQALANQMGGEVREDLVAEVMRRVALEIPQLDTQATPSHQSPRNSIRKIATIKINHVTNGAGVDHGVSSRVVASKLDLTSLVANGVMPRALGFMAWHKSTVPFHSDSDEIHVVLEGELTFQYEKDSLTAVVGDVVLIPKGLTIDIGTRTSVRLLYLSYKG